MDPIWITIAFIFGFIIKLIGLPPLIGYLLAGFILNLLGFQSSNLISTISDLGIILLLFTIGLKFKVSDLLRKEIWASTVIYTFISTILYGVIILIFSFYIFYISTELDIISILLVSFSLSFSSTVFSIKTLENKGEVNSIHGRISIGVLIVQDVFAVLLMAALFFGEISFWVIALPIILLIIRPVLLKIFDLIGHGELLVLYGLFLALVVGAEFFQMLGLKPDLGALVIGMLIAKHAKAKELSNILMNLKDVLLVGFFLSIGLSGLPTKPILIFTVIIIFLLPLKSIMYFLIFTKFGLRSRTAFHSTTTLSTYSEFGLIVTVAGISSGIMEPEWMTVVAIIISLSYILTSPISSRAHKIYAKIKNFLGLVEAKKRLEKDNLFSIGDAEILIFGFGRVGKSVYDQLTQQYGKRVIGIDFDEKVVIEANKLGKNVVQDDATDTEFWETIKQTKPDQVKLVMFCFHDYKNVIFAIERLKYIGFNGTVAALAEFDDQVENLKKMGVDFPFNFYNEAGIGFADSVCDYIGEDLKEI